MAEVTLQALEEEERSLAVGLEALELEYAALHQNTTFMEQQLETQQVLLYALTGHRQVDMMLGAEAGAGFIDQFCPTIEHIRGLFFQEIREMYANYVSTLSAGLTELSSEEVAPGVAAGVEQVAGALATFLLRLSAVRPMEARQFITQSRQQLTTEPEAFAMWRGVVQKLDLGVEQRALVLHWHNEYKGEIEIIRQQGIDLLSCLPQGLFSTTTAHEYIHVTDALGRHAHNLRAEHTAYLKLFSAVCMGALDRKQFATLVVRSHPVVPDALGVVAGILADMASISQTLPDMAEVVPAIGNNTSGSLAAPLLGSVVV